MEGIFESLLLDQVSCTIAADGAASSVLKGPRPSRYAQLIPREALRPIKQEKGEKNESSRDRKDGQKEEHQDDEKKKKKKKKEEGQQQQHQQKNEPEKEEKKKKGETELNGEKKDRENNGEKVKDEIENIINVSKNEGDTTSSSSSSSSGEEEYSEEGDEEEREQVRVFRMNPNTGRAEVLPENEYNVVYFDEDSVQNSEKAEPMEIDDDKSSPKLDSAESDANDDVLFIVRTTLTSTNAHPLSSLEEPSAPANNVGHSSSFGDEASSLSCSHMDDSRPMALDPVAKEAANTASILARALVQRTQGFQNLRPKYGLLEDDEEKQKKKKKDKKKKSTTSANGVAKNEGKHNKDEKNKETEDNADEDYDDDADQPRNSRYKYSHSLIKTIPPSSKVSDGDDPQTMIKLSKLSAFQNSMLQPSMLGVELDDWEDPINWDGGSDGGENADGTKSGANYENPSAAGTEDNVAANSITFPSYQPSKPEGGYAKRARTITQYANPCQILFEPCNPRVDALDPGFGIDWEGGTIDDDADLESDIPIILESSVAALSIAPSLAPVPSRPLPFESHPSYQQRYEREMSQDITSTAEISKGLNMSENEALEKYKEARQRKREQMAKDKQNRVTEVMSTLALGGGTGRRITSSLMGPGGAERTGRPSRHAIGSSSAHDAEYVEQLELVYNHTLVRPDLTLSEYRQFHRPRLPVLVVNPHHPWQFQTRLITAEKKTNRTSADGSTVVGSYHAMMSAGAKAQNKIRNEADLSPSVGDVVVLEYSEERPPLFMTKGMTCRIVNYYRGDRARCPISAGGGDRPLRKRHGDKAASAKGAEITGPSGRIERPPRLKGPNQFTVKGAVDLIGIIGKKKKKNKDAAALEAKKAKEMAVDVLPEGVTEILHPKVHGPFIGEVEEGKTQTGLISNLFAAPMFRHDSEPTDFLMILGQMQPITRRDPNNNALNALGVVLRPLPPNVFCVGQTEPRVKVFSPNTNDEKKFVNAFIPYQVAKNLERTEMREGRGLTFEDIKDRLFANTTIPQTQLRIRIKQVANFDRTNNGIWSLKSVGDEDFPGVEALGRRVSPEGVAAYESQCAAIRRLCDLGIADLYSGGNNIANVAMVMIYLNGAAHAALERKLKLKKVLEIKKRQKSPQVSYFEKAYEKLDSAYKEVKKRQEIAKFIYEELQLSPWHLSGEFIDVHKRAQGTAMMKLTGIGDPSGLGEAYNFLREMDNKPNKATTNSDGALNAQIKKITGTENDLRKLTMKQMASLLRSYGMKDKQIAVLKRWDRVHVIRDLSTKAASDGMGDELERFARGEKLRLSDQRQMYKERIQEIWRRQIAALSADAGNEVARADSVMSSAEDSNKVDGGSDTGEKGDDSDDSDDDDDDFAAMMEMEMTSTGETNRMVAAQLRGDDDGDVPMRSIGSSLDTQELSKDARELAALQRQREEERAMQEGLGLKTHGLDQKKKMKHQKCIRRKVTKTHPDGTQTVTFEFIVQREKVEEIMAKMKKKDIDDKIQAEKKKKRNKVAIGEDSADQDTCVGHAFFEDEDNTTARGRRSLKLKIKKETRIIHKKVIPPPRKPPPMKATSTATASNAKFKMAQEKKKKRRLREMEEADLYKSHHMRKGTNNRRERGAARDRMPHVILADRFENIRSSVEGRPKSGPFRKPVNRMLYPTYYEVICEPIDLQTIREKNRKYEYKMAESFVRDFELMKKNAIKFNSKGSALANEATEIYDFVKTTIEQNRSDFDQMEEAVRDQMNNGQKKKKDKATKTTTENVVSSSSTTKTLNTANVVLDGIETQVNLGENFGFSRFGGDSDSDDS